MATYLNGKLDAPGLPMFYTPVPPYTSCNKRLGDKRLPLSCRMMTLEDSISGCLFMIVLCGLSSLWVYR
ncbi:hypothetical protein TNCV_3724991 [Trichonephila clavipes]|nr:hypothetical protein TNCV_3724991 [Trichonephila clavipes]